MVTRQYVLEATKEVLRHRSGYKPGFEYKFSHLRICRSASSSQSVGQETINMIIRDGIMELGTEKSDCAEILQKRFIDRKSLKEVAHELHYSIDQVSRKQRKAIIELSNHIYVKEAEQSKLADVKMLSSLPAKTYDKFVGHKKTVSSIVEMLGNSTTRQPILITGLGGIGKSTLTDFVVRGLILGSRFDNVYWIRTPNYELKDQNINSILTFEGILLEIAKQALNTNIPPADYLEEIHTHFSQNNILLVIDNLDQSNATEDLINNLTTISSNARVAITSRRNFSQSGIGYTVEIPELSLEDARVLITHQAAYIGQAEMIPDLEKVSSDIYELIGGNPLALKIITGLITVIPFKEVMEEVSSHNKGMMGEIYQSIYSKAWETLSPNSKILLAVFPFLGSNGGVFKQLRHISKLSKESLNASLRELSQKSLIEIRGTLKDKLYGIHKLTETFLRTNILGQ